MGQVEPGSIFSRCRNKSPGAGSLIQRRSPFLPLGCFPPVVLKPNQLQRPRFMDDGVGVGFCCCC
jgi:hypothetical protein